MRAMWGVPFSVLFGPAVAGGAYLNSTEALSSGAQLLELIAVQEAGRHTLLDSGVPAVLLQVITTFAGTNTSSNAVGSTVRVFQQLLGGSESSSIATSQHKQQTLSRNMVASGVVLPLVREVRLGQPASLGFCLGLLAALMEDDSEQSDAAHEAVGAGLLSLCAQLLFQQAASDKLARKSCFTIVRIISQPSIGAQATAEYPNTQEGRVALANALLQLMRQTDQPDLHNAVLESCRDIAPMRAAAEALVMAGVVPQLVHLLLQNVSSMERGIDDAGQAWILQSQRTAAAVVAFLALQPTLREHVVDDGALQGLAASLSMHSGQPGLMGQIRITSAAALVPILGQDERYNQEAITAGVLEPLVKMYYSRNDLERQAAERVLQVLGKDTAVAAMYTRVGIRFG
ncbi:hypothetical protein TSOC_009892 [Tetrabaena socialis]|uniref:Uncharacterized protein n=1 Tax=Tetrabaena socialis TaxID=47790 RepID=A0A2J7ZUP0_9CHLO|nr:hypothetical protein TSOC_009892 [Tetrabaena socialis]|eukprot:PNH03997.1 hypothetical protein TSOC_009892 [Tetrabaena socialis]